MPKNKGSGGKSYRRGRHVTTGTGEIIEKEAGQEYAQVEATLGNLHVQCKCFDGKTRMAKIRGKMAKKIWVGKGDVVLLGLRDYQDEKADVILKYTPADVRHLKQRGQLPPTFGPDDEVVEENNFEFERFEDDQHDDDSDSEADLVQDSRAGMLPPSDSEGEEVNLDDL